MPDFMCYSVTFKEGRLCTGQVPHFVCFKFPSKTIPKNLDPSYKMELELGDCLGRLNLY